MTRRERDAGPKAATRAWLRQETQRGSRAARPVVALGLAGTSVAVGQTYCIARALAAALTGHSLPILALTAFALLALARAALAWAAELLAARAGAASRRRLRSEVMTRLLHAGPALLRQRHSGELAATVVDRVEALDGLYWTVDTCLGPGARRACGGRAGRPGSGPGGGADNGGLRRAGTGRDGGCRNRQRPPRRGGSFWRSRGCRQGSSTACVASPRSCCTGGRRTRRRRSQGPPTSFGSEQCGCCGWRSSLPRSSTSRRRRR